MSVTTSRVRELLGQNSTAEERRSSTGGRRSGTRSRRSGTDTEKDEGSRDLSRSEIKEAVKEGVAEALEEHRESQEDDSTETNTDQSESDTGSSRGGSVLKRLLVLGLLASVAYLARRYQRGDQSDEDWATENQSHEDLDTYEYEYGNEDE